MVQHELEPKALAWRCFGAAPTTAIDDVGWTLHAASLGFASYLMTIIVRAVLACQLILEIPPLTAI